MKPVQNIPAQVRIHAIEQTLGVTIKITSDSKDFVLITITDSEGRSDLRSGRTLEEALNLAGRDTSNPMANVWTALMNEWKECLS